MNDELKLREAQGADIPVLARHRRWMFEEMARVQAVGYTVNEAVEMEAAYVNYLQQNFGHILRAWVIEAAGQIIASGAVLFYDWPPRPGDLTGRAALVHSVYTDPDYRGRGLARRITEHIVGVCRALGYRTVTLHASIAGRPIYEALGFKATSEMRLELR